MEGFRDAKAEEWWAFTSTVLFNAEKDVIKMQMEIPSQLWQKLLIELVLLIVINWFKRSHHVEFHGEATMTNHCVSLF